MDAQAIPLYETGISALVIDGNPESRELLSNALSHSGLNIRATGASKDGLDLFRKFRPQIVLAALGMEGLSGLELLDRIMEIDAATHVVMLCPSSSPDDLVLAIKRGASDFLSTPVSLDDLHQRIGKLVARVDETRRVAEFDNEFQTKLTFEGMVGRSLPMCRLFSQIRSIAPHYRTALLQGETGTGKELVARALHNLSPVSSGRFVVVNCSAIVETLFESELFGHVQGSFTGATRDKIGFFEHAHGGTLFLDEIGDLPLPMQAKLLRVLQNQEKRRVGGLNAREVDVHVVAATNQDLRAAVRARSFREDLYYRVSMVEVHVPRLAERLEDLALLERHLIDQFAAQFRKPIRGITDRAHKRLLQHSWPGNVRELENVLGHACMMTTNMVVDVQDLPSHVQYASDRTDHRNSPAVHVHKFGLAAHERSLVMSALETTNGNQTRAAELLQISRDQLRYRLKKHNLPRGLIGTNQCA